VHLSVLLREALDPARGATLPLAVGVAVARVLDPDRTLGVRLKWPNDLWLQDRKLGGILCERVDGGPALGAAVLVGVGVNIAYAPSELPEATAPAICLREVAPDAPAPRAWAGPLRDAIVAMSDRLARDGAHAWRAEWDARDLTVGRDVTFRAADGERHGRVERVADDGALHVRGPDGVLHRVIAGEVRFRSRG
jgi:BirA family biotin operon repressor/biotin-[acetyl-CoA-carboxylase] ligase